MFDSKKIFYIVFVILWITGLAGYIISPAITFIYKWIINLGLATSKREARTFITGNSVSINGIKHTDPNELINSSLALFNKYLVVKRGKKNYALGEF